MSEVISIIGDSNVNRNLDSTKAANPADHCIRQSHLITAFNAVQLQSSLVGQNEHRRIVVLAALSNPIAHFTFLGGDQLIIDVRLFLQQLCSWIQQGRSFDDGTNQTVLVLPPQFCLQPSWYRQYYTNIMAIFEEAFRTPGPNIWVLPPFMDPEFMEDGYHYTPASGHQYIHHLINSAHQILGASIKPDPVAQSHSSQLQGVRHEISELRFKQIQITAFYGFSAYCHFCNSNFVCGSMWVACVICSSKYFLSSFSNSVLVTIILSSLTCSFFVLVLSICSSVSITAA